MLEGIAWFAVIYACISLTVTAAMLLGANKVFKLGGPFGMIRVIFLLFLAGVGFIIWLVKAVFSESTGTPSDEIKRTVKSTSTWLDGLKSEWQDGKKK